MRRRATDRQQPCRRLHDREGGAEEPLPKNCAVEEAKTVQWQEAAKLFHFVLFFLFLFPLFLGVSSQLAGLGFVGFSQQEKS
jgi:hypothetical protein